MELAAGGGGALAGIGGALYVVWPGKTDELLRPPLADMSLAGGLSAAAGGGSYCLGVPKTLETCCAFVLLAFSRGGGFGGGSGLRNFVPGMEALSCCAALDRGAPSADDRGVGMSSSPGAKLWLEPRSPTPVCESSEPGFGCSV